MPPSDSKTLSEPFNAAGRHTEAPIREQHEYNENLPKYLDEVYNWAYIDENNVERLDNNWVFNILLFGNGPCLKWAYLRNIQPGMRVWQAAHVYGDLVQWAAYKVGINGQFDLTDVAPIQLKHAQRKIGHLPQTAIYQSDAAEWEGKNYDVACSFFLIHEVPDDKKTEIINRMLQSIAPDGQAIFVDYHRPANWQPVGWLLRWVNAKLEPFSNALWQRDIWEFADPELSKRFNWEKRTVFGGVYQAVYATLRD